MTLRVARNALVRLRSLLLPVVLVLLAGCARKPAPTLDAAPPRTADVRPLAPLPSAATAKKYLKAPDAELRQRLSPLEYAVTQGAETEPPFANRYWNHHEEGLYVDAVSGEPLFSSRDKFDSGTGWPSFTRPVDAARVITRTDASLGMVRTEAISRDAGSHLGHVFEDGPAPSGLRYCINSAALRFIPLAKLEQQGYRDYLPLFREGQPAVTAAANANACAAPAPGQAPGCATTFETAVLAGGCFWGMEEILRKIPGVVSTEVGYAGGTPDVTYSDVRTGTTGNAESVRVVFDPKRLAYEDLLEKWFFRMHDPTTANRQGNDVGTQYRSVIFVTSPAQRAVAQRVIARVNASKKWNAPIVTEVVDAGPFTVAEEYHQDYLRKNPGGYTCHYLRD